MLLYKNNQLCFRMYLQSPLNGHGQFFELHLCSLAITDRVGVIARKRNTRSKTHTHTHTHTYIYITLWILGGSICITLYDVDYFPVPAHLNTYSTHTEADLLFPLPCSPVPVADPSYSGGLSECGTALTNRCYPKVSADLASFAWIWALLFCCQVGQLKN